MHGVHEEQQRGSGDEDDVEDPEAILGDGEGHVVADLLAARLEGVTGELCLLVIEEVASDGSQDEDTEDQHEEEPEAPQHGRVDLEGIEEAAEKAPLTHDEMTTRVSPRESAASLFNLQDLFQFPEITAESHRSRELPVML